jgi:hypothetical protein
LLCNSSTYFKAALNNGFSETASQKITLDDDSPDVFRTYAAWLFEHEITNDSLSEVENLERHLFYVYIFADKRGIRCLANDVVTMMCSFWVVEPIRLSTTIECMPLLPPECTLYELALDSLVLLSRQGEWDEDEWEGFCSHPTGIIVELFKREQNFPRSFVNFSNCFESICHYHKHDDHDEKDGCIKNTERGRNVFSGNDESLKQIERRW